MKKIIALLIIMISSFILSALFFFSSGLFDFSYGHITNETINVLNNNLDNFFILRFNDGNCENTSIDETISLNLSEISLLKISSLSTDVEIIETNSEYATIHLAGSGCDHRLISSKTGDVQNIYIEYPLINGWFTEIRTNLNMKIYLPKDYGKSIEVDTLSGEIKLDKLNGDNCYFATISGKVSLNDFNCEEVSIKTTSGEIEINNGTFTEIKTVSGDVSLMQVLFKEKSNIITISGNVELNEIESSDLKINFNSVSGEIRGKTIYENNDKILFVKTTSGNLNIN